MLLLLLLLLAVERPTDLEAFPWSVCGEPMNGWYYHCYCGYLEMEVQMR
jgi:hypothetical protein